MPTNETAPSKDARRVLLRTSTAIQSISALSFSAFLVLHLAAPLSAAFGLDASQTMLLAREYYQTAAIEPVLVWGSLIAHVSSNLVRRTILGGPSSLRRLSWHSITGYILVPLVAAHAWTHRILPAKRGISPSLLSYQYVSYSLFKYPITSWVAYGAITLASSYHAISGLRSIVSRGRKAAVLPQSMSGLAGSAALVGGVGLGLVRLASEGSDVPLWLGKRYLQVLQEAYLQ